MDDNRNSIFHVVLGNKPAAVRHNVPGGMQRRSTEKLERISTIAAPPAAIGVDMEVPEYARIAQLDMLVPSLEAERTCSDGEPRFREKELSSHNNQHLKLNGGIDS